MKNSKQSKFLIYLFLTLSSLAAKADFGEVDLITRESVENHFREYDQDVKMNTLQIDRVYSEPINSLEPLESTLRVETLVKAYHEDLSAFAWYSCRTRIKVSKEHRLTDLGTDCFLDVE
ncbi:MAG: hypothetical protein ACK5P7_13880 [Bdellovibrio sp.]|jgi:hypothetical protein